MDTLTTDHNALKYGFSARAPSRGMLAVACFGGGWKGGRGENLWQRTVTQHIPLVTCSVTIVQQCSHELQLGAAIKEDRH
tara:strand:- start:137 stop:376 length:240 start_codon:yes stop_codon:yes gene_type:complete